MQTSIVTQIETLLRACDNLPKEAIREIIARRDDAIQPLLDILGKAASDPDSAAGLDYMGHIYAAMLLAVFRERRAHPLLLEIMSLPDPHLIQHVWGGMMLDYMPRLMAMTAGPDVSGLIRLADDEKAWETARELAIEALICLVARGEQSREPVIALLRRLLTRPRSRAESSFVTFISMIAADIHPGEMMDEIGMQITSGNIDSEYLSMDELKLMAAEPVDTVLERTRDSVTMRYFDDVIAEMSGWDCFNPEETKKQNQEQRDAMRRFFEAPPNLPGMDDEDPLPPDDGIEDAIVPSPGPHARPRRGPETGRNEPCPCGSGKKYKKCCGQGA
ncbi:MAG TPA: DUF1186 domain-containing protein [Candidatus Ozemobacteraceae bacterium]|nr:DUF1186 domain-containing protein [Candidatus Ozemobacteraceae bacterium]